jgi:hypothetical protein
VNINKNGNKLQIENEIFINRSLFQFMPLLGGECLENRKGPLKIEFFFFEKIYHQSPKFVLTICQIGPLMNPVLAFFVLCMEIGFESSTLIGIRTSLL